MLVNGCDCSIVVKTAYREMGIPYSEETLREAVSLLEEEAAIEGDGVCRALRKASGVTGCVVTPLTIETVSLLLYLAMGSARATMAATQKPHDNCPVRYHDKRPVSRIFDFIHRKPA